MYIYLYLNGGHLYLWFSVCHHIIFTKLKLLHTEVHCPLPSMKIKVWESPLIINHSKHDSRSYFNRCLHLWDWLRDMEFDRHYHIFTWTWDGHSVTMVSMSHGWPYCSISDPNHYPDDPRWTLTGALPENGASTSWPGVNHLLNVH